MSNISPLKTTTRGGSYDTSSIITPASPLKARTVRRLRSHQQLPSHSPSLITQQRQQHQQHQQHQHQLPNGLSSPEFNDQISQVTSNTSLGVGRIRANSDAPMPFKKPNLTRRLPASATHGQRSDLESLVRDGPPGGNIDQGLAEIRFHIVSSGVEAGKDGMSEYRCYLWLLLLNVPPLPTDDYHALLRRGPSSAYEKISDDTFRTLATDALFKRRVRDTSITRVLNVTAWKLHDAQKAVRVSCPTLSEQRATNDSALYVQGMNVLSAPFLYAARSEAEAFSLFHTFLTRECPGYIRGAMEGVHKGLALVDKCLAIVNPTLAQFLQSKKMPAELYAFASVLTFCACTPPLPQLLHLWDFLFAYGPQLNILCIVAQLLLLKDTLLASPSPTKVLRSFPPLEAKKIIDLTFLMVREVPDDVFDELLNHAN